MVKDQGGIGPTKRGVDLECQPTVIPKRTEFDLWARKKNTPRLHFARSEFDQSFFQVINPVDPPIPLAPILKHRARVMSELLPTCVPIGYAIRCNIQFSHPVHSAEFFQRGPVSCPESLPDFHHYSP